MQVAATRSEDIYISDEEAEEVKLFIFMFKLPRGALEPPHPYHHDVIRMISDPSGDFFSPVQCSPLLLGWCWCSGGECRREKMVAAFNYCYGLLICCGWCGDQNKRAQN